MTPGEVTPSTADDPNVFQAPEIDFLNLSQEQRTLAILAVIIDIQLWRADCIFSATYTSARAETRDSADLMRIEDGKSQRVQQLRDEGLMEAAEAVLAKAERLSAELPGLPAEQWWPAVMAATFNDER